MASVSRSSLLTKSLGFAVLQKPAELRNIAHAGVVHVIQVEVFLLQRTFRHALHKEINGILKL